jgi:2-polyprenyl-3-methyl-5-hydroxy-6-metoxy-1,4-benzoquinol methylase
MDKHKFELQDDTCFMCQSPNLRRFKAQASDAVDQSHVNIVECEQCAFAWQYPLARTVEQSIEFFQSAYADGGKVGSAYFDPQRKQDIAKLEFEFIATLSVKNRRLLDVGAGAGIFADIATGNGWDVTAVDPAIEVDSIGCHTVAKKIKGTIDDIPKDELFDVVTLWDVIEHTENPLELITAAKQRLHETGWVVIETGNYKSAQRVSSGGDHWIYQHDHRWYFSPDSMRAVLMDAGFDEFIFSEKILRPNWQSGFYSGPSKLSLIKSIVKNPLKLPQHLSKYHDLLKAKDWELSGMGIFAVAARKRKTIN